MMAAPGVRVKVQDGVEQAVQDGDSVTRNHMTNVTARHYDVAQAYW